MKPLWYRNYELRITPCGTSLTNLMGKTVPAMVHDNGMQLSPMADDGRFLAHLQLF
jgi:hypothetical protein